MLLVNKIHLIPYSFLINTKQRILPSGIYFCLKSLPMNEVDEFTLLRDIINTCNSYAQRPSKSSMIEYGRKFSLFQGLSKQEVDNVRSISNNRINCIEQVNDTTIRLVGDSVFDPTNRIHKRELSIQEASLLLDIMYFYIFANTFSQQKRDFLFKEFFETQKYYGYVLAFKEHKFADVRAELLDLTKMPCVGVDVPINIGVCQEIIEYVLKYVSHYNFAECKYTNLADLKFRQDQVTLVKPSKRFGITSKAISLVKRFLLR